MERYRRLLKGKLVIAEKRLWVETIFMNIVSLGFFSWAVLRIELPFIFAIIVPLWNVIAICLALKAFVQKT